jgi:hypothetical protein
VNVVLFPGTTPADLGGAADQVVPNENLIFVLERAIELARNGTMRSMIMVFEKNCGCLGTLLNTDQVNSYFNLSGALRVEEHKIITMMADSSTEVSVCPPKE